MSVAVFECVNCKGALEYTPGTASLTCPYCGTVNELPEPERPETFEELDYERALADFEASAGTVEVVTATCPGCRAEVTLPPDQSTHSCDFCGTPVVAEGAPHKAMEPQYMLPFAIDQAGSREKYRSWLAGLRLAPKSLKQKARLTEPLKGIYLPFWTFDAATQTDYRGERGEYYYETVTVTDKDGKSSTKQVRKTRWHPASGHVSRAFDDVLVPASQSVPRKLLDRIRTWNLGHLIAFDRQYLAGFAAETYTTDITGGLDEAKVEMTETIEEDVRRDIGGDTQRIKVVDTKYSDITFKYVLLPVWATKYRFKDTYYSVVVNGQTGEVQGERPIAWGRIIITLLIVAALGVGAYVAYQYFAGGG